ncbi:aldolase [Paenibacillus nanensis]|uniref:Aldolase n=1 Tax=Paenibacillus nanensis TaxID=393251 RepID=A0A3A1UY55_9BACL|nr:aldolase [Paenibacillus nanensis]RIX52616.1 aldolase [Paenibacillus nanensis]
MILIILDRNYRYRSFGLSIESEFQLPELSFSEHELEEEQPGLTIAGADLMETWDSLNPVGAHLAIEGETVYVRVPDTGIFAMENGQSILVSLFPEANMDKVRLYLLGSCMGVILMQRRILPLHGSAIAINGKAYAIVGHSGAGKTTLSTYLLEQGYQLLSDDLIAVTLDQDDNPIVTPSYPQQKIWQETIDLLGMKPERLKPLFERETKFAVPVSDRFHSSPLPLAGVYELIKVEQGAALQPVEGLERFHTLLQHTFRGFLIERLGLMDWHFGFLARFVNRIQMHRLCRPQAPSSVQELAELLIQTTAKENRHI